MPVTFSRGGDVFDVYQGNGTFRVNHKGVDILDYRVGDAAPVDPAPVDPAPVDPVPTPPVVGGTVAANLAELQTLLSSAKAGDTIGLKNGEYGAAPLSKSGVTIVAENTHGAHFDQISVQNCDGMRLSGMEVSPSGLVPWSTTPPWCINGRPTATNLQVDGVLLKGSPDADNFHNFSKAEWLQRCQAGAYFAGAGSSITDSQGVALFGGFFMDADGGTMRNIKLDGCSGDMFRATASNITINRIFGQDAFLIDGNHPDALQIFKANRSGGFDPVTDLDVSEFIFVESTQNHISEFHWDAQNNRYGILQGLAAHNTNYHRFKIADGIVKVGHWNGVRLNSVQGVDVQRVHCLSVYKGMPEFKADAPWLSVTGSGVNVQDCTAQNVSQFADRTRNGPADYNMAKPAWAVAMGY